MKFSIYTSILFVSIGSGIAKEQGAAWDQSEAAEQFAQTFEQDLDSRSNERRLWALSWFSAHLPVPHVQPQSPAPIDSNVNDHTGGNSRYSDQSGSSASSGYSGSSAYSGSNRASSNNYGGYDTQNQYRNATNSSSATDSSTHWWNKASAASSSEATSGGSRFRFWPFLLGAALISIVAGLYLSARNRKRNESTDNDLMVSRSIGKDSQASGEKLKYIENNGVEQLYKKKSLKNKVKNVWDKARGKTTSNKAVSDDLERGNSGLVAGAVVATGALATGAYIASKNRKEKESTHADYINADYSGAHGERSIASGGSKSLSSRISESVSETIYNIQDAFCGDVDDESGPEEQRSKSRSARISSKLGRGKRDAYSVY